MDDQIAPLRFFFQEFKIFDNIGPVTDPMGFISKRVEHDLVNHFLHGTSWLDSAENIKILTQFLIHVGFTRMDQYYDLVQKIEVSDWEFGVFPSVVETWAGVTFFANWETLVV
jgi:hypothetical protein